MTFKKRYLVLVFITLPLASAWGAGEGLNFHGLQRRSACLFYLRNVVGKVPSDQVIPVASFKPKFQRHVEGTERYLRSLNVEGITTYDAEKLAHAGGLLPRELLTLAEDFSNRYLEEHERLQPLIAALRESHIPLFPNFAIPKDFEPPLTDPQKLSLSFMSDYLLESSTLPPEEDFRDFFGATYKKLTTKIFPDPWTTFVTLKIENERRNRKSEIQVPFNLSSLNLPLSEANARAILILKVEAVQDFLTAHGKENPPALTAANFPQEIFHDEKEFLGAALAYMQTDKTFKKNVWLEYEIRGRLLQLDEKNEHK